MGRAQHPSEGRSARRRREARGAARVRSPSPTRPHSSIDRRPMPSLEGATGACPPMHCMISVERAKQQQTPPGTPHTWASNVALFIGPGFKRSLALCSSPSSFLTHTDILSSVMVRATVPRVPRSCSFTSAAASPQQPYAPRRLALEAATRITYNDSAKLPSAVAETRE